MCPSITFAKYNSSILTDVCVGVIPCRRVGDNDDDKRHLNRVKLRGVESIHCEEVNRIKLAQNKVKFRIR
jgi:hypothetical protein